MLDAIRESAIEFLKKSNAWRYDVDPITVAANATIIELDLPRNTRIRQILDATYAGGQLKIYERDEINKLRPNYLNETGNGINAVVPVVNNEVRVMPTPSVAALHPVLFTVSLYLTEAAITIDSDVYEEWRDVIRFGALHRLQIMPNKPWSNMEMAGINLGKFRSGISDARIQALRGNNGTMEMYRRDFRSF
jgi:hypothetical protein